MPSVSLSVVATVANRPKKMARFVLSDGAVVTLPWWPDEVAWARNNPSWVELPRPGKEPLLVQEFEQLPTLSIGCIVTAEGDDRINYDAPAWPVLGRLKRAAVEGETVYLLLGSSYATTPWKITQFDYTELDWTSSGNVSRAEVSMVLTRESDASAPRGPVKPQKPKKKKKGK